MRSLVAAMAGLLLSMVFVGYALANKYADTWWLTYHMEGYTNELYWGPYGTKLACLNVVLDPGMVFIRCQFNGETI